MTPLAIAARAHAHPVVHHYLNGDQGTAILIVIAAGIVALLVARAWRAKAAQQPRRRASSSWR